VSAQTDVYSLGVMAYELFLEQLPFEAETSAEIMAMHLRCTPPPPSELWPDIPPTLENLVLAMLAKDPDARPTMLTVAHTLETVRADLHVRMQSVSVDERPSGRIATPVPALRRASSRHDVANGFSPTEPAAWPETRRRWHVAIGALAVAASAAMFLLTRSTERANAAAPKHAIVESAVADTVATPTPVPPAPASIVEAKAAATDIIPAVAPARAEPPAIKPTVLRNSAATKRSQSSSRKVPVKPRRNLEPIDPDGTLDPYL
jgi:serine/threonine-protein kinase